MKLLMKLKMQLIKGVKRFGLLLRIMELMALRIMIFHNFQVCLGRL